MYIDVLLDSAIPHELLNEYQAELEASQFRPLDVPDTIREEPSTVSTTPTMVNGLDRAFVPGSYGTVNGGSVSNKLSTRTPQDIFRSSESLPLLQRQEGEEEDDEDDEDDLLLSTTPNDGSGPKPNLPWLEDADVDSDDPIVTLAIWVNFIANAILLAGKLAVIISVPSMSVLASLVDAVLDFLSTAIVYTTTRLISHSQQDQHSYPVGRRK